MACHDYRKRIPEYISGSMPGKEQKNFEKHLEVCPGCFKEVKEFKQLETMIGIAAVQVPQINLAAQVLSKVRRPRRNSAGLLTDLLAAWAVAVIIFWFSSPLLLGSGVPQYTEGVSRTSTKITASLNEAYRSYINYALDAAGKVSGKFKEIGSEIMKGDER